MSFRFNPVAFFKWTHLYSQPIMVENPLTNLWYYDSLGPHAELACRLESSIPWNPPL